jgi:hypothetical protein
MREFVLSIALAVAVVLPSQSQDLLHYWNFNEGAGSAGIAWPSPIEPSFSIVDGATIEHTFADGTLQSFVGTTENSQLGDGSGGSFSVQVGAGRVNNGAHFDLIIPSTEYEGIFVTYATRGTGTGFDTHHVSYSLDGETFVPFTTIAASTTADWIVPMIDLATITPADDNQHLIVRIMVDGGSSDSGNNRFDNIAVFGYTDADNRPPHFITVLEDQSIDAGEAFSFQFEAEDPRGDAIIFNLEDAPPGAEIDPSSGLFTWTPTSEQGAQSWTIRVSITDGEFTASTDAELSVVAFPDNTPPVFTSALPDTLVRVGDNLTWTFEAFDEDGDEVTFSVVDSPEGVTFDEASASLSWTVTTPGAYQIVVTASDGLETTHHYSIVGVRGLILPDLEGAELREQLRELYTPDQVFNYDDARDSMYAVLDLDLDGYVRGVYSGFAVKLEGSGTPRSIMNNGGIDAEHTWPQSRGAGAGMPRSDLHHLFPTRAVVNNARGNLPFADIAAAYVNRWYKDDFYVTDTPQEPENYSRLGSDSFQPRDVHMGPGARSKVYFYAIYEDVADEAFFLQQVDAIVAWSREHIPAASEVRRTHKISTWQGNVNPFIFDSTLAVRMVRDVTEPAVIPIGEARQLEDGTSIVVEGIVTRAKGRYMRFQDETGAMNVFQSSGSLFDAIGSGAVAEGDSFRVAGSMATFSELRQIGSLVSWEVLSRGHDLPEPAHVTLTDLAENGEDYESLLVRVEGFRIDASGTFTESTTYNLLNADGSPASVDLRIQRSSDSELVGEAIPEGLVAFEGVLGRHYQNFQLDGVRSSDITAWVGTNAPELANAAFSVSPVYPNPTSGLSQLSISSPAPTHVRVELYDALGRRLSVLHDGIMSGAAQNVRIDSNNLSSGLYLVRITSDDGIHQQSVVVVR